MHIAYWSDTGLMCNLTEFSNSFQGGKPRNSVLQGVHRTPISTVRCYTSNPELSGAAGKPCYGACNCLILKTL